MRPPIHTLAYADSGAGKSTFAATFPKPMLVFMFDPYGKELPYVRRGLLENPARIAADERGTPISQVWSKKTSDLLLIQIEHYLDNDFRQPEAYSRFLDRLTLFQAEYDRWATVVLDSVTFAGLTARMWHKWSLNRNAKDGRHWFGGETDLIEEILMGRFASMPMNVVVLAHVDEDKDEMHGTFVRSPKMPGQRLRKGVMAAYQEVYHLGLSRDEKGEVRRVLQTQSDTMWNAATQIDAPNGCEPDYARLWANFDQEEVK